MHLVLGVDDSPCSTAAVEFVRHMSWPPATTATVVCALPPFVTAVPEAYLALADTLESLRREQRATNEAHAREVASALVAAGVHATPSAPDGDPRVALIEVARREHADLLVVGSHGRTGLTKLVLGSVASHVATHAPCSVLVVRRDGARS
jgi:nucleotide-binding universal stress UspA family protein